MAIDTNYFLQKGESNDAYNSRIAAYNASKNAPTASTGNDAFMETLQNKLLGQADMISSSSTNLESKINEAIGGVQKAGEASRAALESSSNREIAFQKEQFAQDRTGVLESQRGFAVNQAALTQLDERTEKSLRDMEQRKQELILQGDAATASKISELQFKALEFQQQSQQNAFNNLLGLGQFAQGLKGLQLQVKQEARLSSAQEWQQKYDEAKFAFDKTRTLEEQRQSQIRLNIMSQELKLKQIEAGVGLTPDPGFATVAIGNSVGSDANEKLTLIQARKDKGEIDDTQAEALTLQAYMDLRRLYSKSEASDDAIASKLGMKFSEDGELGFIAGDVNEVRLPGEQTTLVNMLTKLGEGIVGAEQGFVNFLFGTQIGK